MKFIAEKCKNNLIFAKIIINNNTNISIYMKKLFTLTALLFGMLHNVMADDITTATYGNATGNTERTITVALNHTKDYCAFLLDLTLPTGATIADDAVITAKAPLKNGGTTTINNESVSTDFILSGKLQADGKYRIIGYNFGNVAIGEGDILLSIPVSTTSNDATITVDASNVTFISKDNNNGSYSEIAFEEQNVKADDKPRIWGDVNGDGSVDTTDVQATANISVNKANIGKVDKFAADVNGDEEINSNDVQKIANISVGK